jgi:transcriptional regulator with XRE-family HTH domain
VAVAGLVGRSESWLSQVERGVLRMDSHAVLLDLARVLRVDITDLTGEQKPAGPAAGPGALERTSAIERALLAGGGDASTEDLWPAVQAAHVEYQAAHYDLVLDRLPALIAALDGETAPEVVTAGHTVVAKALTKIGAVDLALIAADRAVVAARRSGDAADLGMATYQVVCALLPTTRAALAEGLAVETAEQLNKDSGPAAWSARGALWLIGAVAAARRGDRDAAAERLDGAGRLAELLGADGNHRWTAFGPTNVAIHRVSVAVELGDASAALAAAEGVDVDRLPVGLSSRRVQVQLDLAWAHAQRRRDADALVALLEVERAAPQAAHRNVVARDTIRRLLARARGSTGPAVRGLADRAGVVL